MNTVKTRATQTQDSQQYVRAPDLKVQKNYHKVMEAVVKESKKKTSEFESI